MGNCIFIGVAGGSGSGKTTVAHNLVKAFSEEDAILVEQDVYYRELSHLTLEERALTNFDHPNAIDFELMGEHLNNLKKGINIERPTYDFKTHSRKLENILLKPSRIIIVEGILIFAVKEIR
ncbi:MAG: uridine kinase, partial [Fusobacteriaceae bacterium]